MIDQLTFTGAEVMDDCDIDLWDMYADFNREIFKIICKILIVGDTNYGLQNKKQQ